MQNIATDNLFLLRIIPDKEKHPVLNGHMQTFVASTWYNLKNYLTRADSEIPLSGTDVIIGYVLIAIGGINLLATQFQIANLYKTRF